MKKIACIILILFIFKSNAYPISFTGGYWSTISNNILVSYIRYTSESGIRRIEQHYVGSSDTFTVDLFYRDCGGFMSVDNLDTLIHLDIIPTPPITLIVRAVYDTNTVITGSGWGCDTSCCFWYTDTLYLGALYPAGIAPHNPNTLGATIYPMPANDYVWLTLPTTTQATNYTLLDTKGRVLKKDNLEPLRTKIDVSGYATGIYFLKINTPTYSETQKISILKD